MHEPNHCRPLDAQSPNHPPSPSPNTRCASDSVVSDLSDHRGYLLLTAVNLVVNSDALRCVQLQKTAEQAKKRRSLRGVGGSFNHTGQTIHSLPKQARFLAGHRMLVKDEDVRHSLDAMKLQGPFPPSFYSSFFSSAPTRHTVLLQLLLRQCFDGVRFVQWNTIQVLEGNDTLDFIWNALQTGLEIGPISDRHTKHISLQLGDLPVLVVHALLLQETLHALQLLLTPPQHPHLFRLTHNQHTRLLYFLLLLLHFLERSLALRLPPLHKARSTRVLGRRPRTPQGGIEVRHPEEHAAATEQVERRGGELEREAGENGVGGVGGRRKWREILNVEVVCGEGEKEEEGLKRTGVGAEEEEMVGVKSCALVMRLEGKDDSWVENLGQRRVVGNVQPLPLGAFE